MIRVSPVFIGLFSRDLHLHVGPEWNSDQRAGYDLYSVSFLLLHGGRRPLLDAGKGFISQRKYRYIHNETVGSKKYMYKLSIIVEISTQEKRWSYRTHYVREQMPY